MTFDEWFHKEYEPADLQIKQYAERNEGLHIPATVYLEDLKGAFEAGLHTDVHTDNSKVIAELEARCNELFLQTCGQAEKIAELEERISNQGESLRVTMLEEEKKGKRIAELEKENAELKTQVKTAYRKGMRHMVKALKDYDRTDGAWTDYFEHTVDKVLQREQLDFEKYGTLAEQLTKAKELLKRCYDNYIYLQPLRGDIEQFLNSEVEK